MSSWLVRRPLLLDKNLSKIALKVFQKTDYLLYFISLSINYQYEIQSTSFFSFNSLFFLF